MKYIPIVFILAGVMTAHAQDAALTLNDAIQQALDKHPAVEAARLETSRLTILERTAFELPKTDVSLLYGQYNSIQRGDNNLTISQSIPFPAVFVGQKTVNKAMTKAAMQQEIVSKNELVFLVKQTFNQLLHLKALHECLAEQDSLLTALLHVAEIQYKTGEATLLTVTMTETQLMEVKNLRARSESDKQIALNHLQRLCQSPSITDIAGSLETFTSPGYIGSLTIDTNPSVVLSRQQIEVADSYRSVEVSRIMPDLRVAYFNQSLIGMQNVNGQDQYFDSHKRFQGFGIGLSFPLWLAPHIARVKAAVLSTTIARKQRESLVLSINQQYDAALQELSKNNTSLTYYREYALKSAALLAAQSQQAFRSGEVDQATVLLNVKQSLAIREGYLNALQQYNQSVITIDYLTGNL
ncbi:TolC family protein [Ohtaekwangia kribbensis]|jgi:cobalt-zinc-cadmium resistance protein CzcA|uniref:TolC family protein n=1 Tax=Ohtaekwangia kribbensis TaxID=688913 RepID=A0ABW3KBB3_9BACT